MKKLIMITCILLATYSIVGSQVRFDVKLGVSPGSTPLSAGIIVNRHNPYDEFQFNMIHVKPQYYAGIGANVQLEVPFFLEGGILCTQRTSLYQINYRIVTEINPAENYMSESEVMILLPLNLGVNLGSIDVTSGLTIKRTISTINELTQLKGFACDDNAFRLGWQMGVRYSFHRTLVGVEYLGSLNRVGQGMYVNAQSLEIMNVPGEFVFSVQYGF